MSARDKQYPLRLSDEERKQLENEAEKAGFTSVSEFIRYMTIGEGRTIQEDLKTILKKLDKK